MKLSEVIQFNDKTGQFDIVASARQVTTRQVDDLLAEVFSAMDAEKHDLLAATILEPIELAIPYVELYSRLFNKVNYDYTEDNALPVEDIVTIGWETHPNARVLFTEPGYNWVRPTFKTFDTGIRLLWSTMRNAGWNVLGRALRRATEDLARQRDASAKAVIDAALASLPTHNYTVSGTLTKTAVDTVLKDAAAIGFPVTQAIVNPGRMMDMATFVYPNGFVVPESQAKEVLTTLAISNYGGVTWFANPNAPVNEVLFSGPSDSLGYHQVRGRLQKATQEDIVNKATLYAIYDAEHAWHIANPFVLRRITIT